MVDDDFGMPDTPWSDDDDWNHCRYNPASRELVVGQAVRLNLIDLDPSADPQFGHILGFRSLYGRPHAMVRWPDAEELVPRWLLVKV
ncbi:hypothetical protein ACLQ29_31510 [Micromonospora sp. DT228]|uniref:hypothetical protein n=1 Tax=Micromonospora sp. DT228 TaxID=3393443 RepID=UPI003CE84F26